MTAMVTVIVVPATAEDSANKQELDGDFKRYQELVGGDVQVITVGDICFLINEEGKVHGLPMNTWATAYLYDLAPEWQGHDFLVGTVVIVGDGGDDFTSVPRQVLEAFLLTGQ